MDHPDIRALCDWFLSCDRDSFPKPPFQLMPYQRVIGEAFFDALERETATAISYLDGERLFPPVRIAGLLKDLESLKALSSVQIEDDW